MLADMLADMMLQSDMPEDEKISIRIIKQADIIHGKLNSLVERFANPKAGETYENKKQVLEYLGLVEVGVNQFIASIVPNETNVPNENN